jgi:hypothetical protein
MKAVSANGAAAPVPPQSTGSRIDEHWFATVAAAAKPTVAVQDPVDIPNTFITIGRPEVVGKITYVKIREDKTNSDYEVRKDIADIILKRGRSGYQTAQILYASMRWNTNDEDGIRRLLERMNRQPIGVINDIDAHAQQVAVTGGHRFPGVGSLDGPPRFDTSSPKGEYANSKELNNILEMQTTDLRLLFLYTCQKADLPRKP